MILEIAFLIDATGSMSSYISESKNTMKKIIDFIDNRLKTKVYCKINYGIVTYTDHEPNGSGSF